MAKIGLYSDLHLHLWKSFGVDEKTGLPSRFLEQMDVLNQMKEVFVSNECSLIINGGDVFHKDSDVPIECINAMNKFVSDLSKVYVDGAYVKQLWVFGNHDSSNKKTPSWLNKTYWHLDQKLDLDIIDSKFGKIKLVDYSDTTSIDYIKGFDLVVVHKQPTVTNRHGYTYEGVDWRILSENNRLVFYGHYHNRQILCHNSYIVGPPMLLNFGEEGDRGVWIIDSETWKVDFIKLRYPEFITVDKPEEVKKDGNYYRVLDCKEKIQDDHVISVITPEFFEERIKSTDFYDVLKEWVEINKKDEKYYKIIEPLVKQKIQSVKDIFKGRIKKVSIKNFFSIGEISYQLNDGIFVVTGKNEDFDSNGSGKTSIFEAIYWCLFGETTKGTLRQEEMVRDGEKDCEVTIFLGYTDHLSGFLISRSKRNGLKILNVDSGLTVIKDLTEGKTKPECDKLLIDILGFNEIIYKSSCYFSQENLVMLTGLGDSARTNMITDLLGFETYDDLHAMLSEKIKVEEKEIEKKVVERNSREAEERSLSYLVSGDEDRLKAQVEKVNDKTIIITRKNEEARILNERLNTLEPPKIEIGDIDSKIQNIESGIQVIKAQRLDFEKTIVIRRTEQEESKRIELDYFSKFDNVSCLRELYIKEISNVGSVHETKDGQFCSHCGSIITKEGMKSFLDDRQGKIKNQDEIISVYKIKHQDQKKNTDSIFNDIYNLNQSINGMNSVVDKKETELKDSHFFKSKILDEKRQYDLKKAELSLSLSSIKTFLEQLESDIQALNREKEMIGFNLRKNQGLLDSNREAVIKIDQGILLIKADLEILNFWKESFSSTGIRSVLLDRFCNEFNSLVNSYLSAISSGVMSIVISPTKKLGSGVERNKIALTIRMGEIERNYLALSGGEKRRVDISLCLALNKWVSNKHQIENGLLGFIILDELFSFVDRVGEENIYHVLYSEAKKKSIFIITHTADIASYSRNIWTVCKKNRISSLEVYNG